MRRGSSVEEGGLLPLSGHPSTTAGTHPPKVKPQPRSPQGRCEPLRRPLGRPATSLSAGRPAPGSRKPAGQVRPVPIHPISRDQDESLNHQPCPAASPAAPETAEAAMRAAAILVLCASLAACSQTATESAAYTSEPAKPARTAAAEKPKPSPVAAKAAACDEAIKRQS